MADPGLVRRRLELHARMVETLAEGEAVEQLRGVAAAIAGCYRGGGKVILFGNGGSAADAQHIAGEFTGRMLVDRPPLPAVALADNAAGFSAIGNDYGYVEVFARQIRAFGRAGDVAIGLSTSGGSANVLAGMRVARDLDLVTVGITGPHGHRLAELSDHAVQIPAEDTPVIQEGTMLALHTICVLVDDELFGE
jgi:D-sedoheptulose 7-phosphate isomerase